MNTLIGDGEIGGKAKGFFKAKAIILSEESLNRYPKIAELLRFPESICVGSNVFDRFISENNFAELTSKYNWRENEDFGGIREKFSRGRFSEDIKQQLKKLLEEITYPLAVRSSSTMEDSTGISFAGKYDTIFISNRGPLNERLEQLLHAIKQIYASTFNPSALHYRRKRNLLGATEHMAILIQQAVGREYKGYFLPLIAGVGFSRNGYCWNPEIKPEDGLVRLVFGLGTRAVGRGYARLFSPGKPTIRPEGEDAFEIQKFSQATIDALNLEANRLESFHFSKLVKNGFDCYPRAERLFSLRDGNLIYVPVSNTWSKTMVPVITFDYILRRTWCSLYLPDVIKTVFDVLERHLGYAVDIEFAVRVDDDSETARFYILQARPLSQREFMKPEPIPEGIPEKDKIFSVAKNSPSGSVSKIEYIVYVDPALYHNVPLEERHEVARVVGKINQLLQGKIFVLMGPGRWGSANIALGVPTKYAELANCSILVEVARQTGRYVPEVSFGTHFFQDLIEDRIFYLPLYPDEPETIFNEDFFRSENSFRKLLPDDYYARFEPLIKVIHIPSVSGGRFAKAALNGEEDRALIYLEPPSKVPQYGILTFK